MIRLKRLTEHELLVKAEFLNPGGSIKDRVALFIIERAEQRGEITPGKTTIVEATSGNTGIGVALVGVQKGYRVRIFMPENMSEERKKIIRAFGAELVLTSAEEGIKGAVDAMRDYLRENPDAWPVNQFSNPDNALTHYEWTAKEIWEQTGGDIYAFVAGVGSGGTLTGVGRFLKEKDPRIKVVAVEPQASAALLGREPGLHVIQGIGDGFVPPVLDVNLIDMVITVTDEDAISTTRALAREEGLLCGTSSGANVWAALQIAGKGRRIVTVAPDRAERYFSTALL